MVIEPSGANSVGNYTSDLQYRTNTKRKSDLSITTVLEEPINENYARLHRHDVGTWIRDQYFVDYNYTSRKF